MSEIIIKVNEGNFDQFRKQVQAGVEYISGSPITKKQGKLDQTCAIVLGKGNTDRLFAALKGPQPLTALALVNDGRCPVCGSKGDHTFDLRDAVGCQRIACHCGAEWHEYSDPSIDKPDGKWEIRKVSIIAFPQLMNTKDLRAFINRNLNTGLSVQNKPVEDFGVAECPKSESTPDSELVHWHQQVTGYREELWSWFPSAEELEEVDMQQTTLAYLHTTSEWTQDMPLEQALGHETHYELVEITDRHGSTKLMWYRIFRVGGNSWALSRDEELDLSDSATDARAIARFMMWPNRAIHSADPTTLEVFYEAK